MKITKQVTNSNLTIGFCLSISKTYVVSTQAETLLSNLLGKDAFYLYMHLDEQVDTKIFDEFIRGIIYLSHSQTKEMFIKHQNFCGQKFQINNGVLTPHIQTQEITYTAMAMINEFYKDGFNLNALDMCCGSGVIGISIKKKYPQISMTLSDISLDALNVASLNATSLEVQVNLIESDLFSNISEKYQLITINPPYLKSNHDGIKAYEEKTDINQFAGLEGHNFHISGNLSNEPKESIIGGETGFEFYERITKQVDSFFSDDLPSFLVLEYDESQKDIVNDIISFNLKNIILRNYYSFKGEPRAAFIFRGLTSKQLDTAIPKVLKKIPIRRTNTNFMHVFDQDIK